MYLCVHTCTYVCIHVCVYVLSLALLCDDCLLVSMYVCMHVCWYVCTYVCVWVSVHLLKTHDDTRSHVSCQHKVVSVSVCMCTCACVRMKEVVYMRTKRTCGHPSNAGMYNEYIHRCMHACMHTYTHTYVWTYIHTYTYTYTHETSLSLGVPAQVPLLQSADDAAWGRVPGPHVTL
jgi:hypothetical protein